MARNLDFDPHNLPSNILEAVGLVAMCSAQTEHIVEQGIGGCLGIDIEYTAAVSTHMATPMRDQILRAAAEIHINNLDDLDELDRLLDEIKQAISKRNEYVHNSICHDLDTGEFFMSTTEARGSVEAELVPISVEAIKASAIRIYQAGLALYSFLGTRQLLARIPPSPRPREHKTKAARKKRREGDSGR